MKLSVKKNANFICVTHRLESKQNASQECGGDKGHRWPAVCQDSKSNVPSKCHSVNDSLS